MKYKKASHVGVMLSFVIFISFMIFIFTTLQPMMKDNQDKDSFVSYLESEINKKVEDTLFKITLSSSELSSSLNVEGNSLGVCLDNYYAVIKNTEDFPISFSHNNCDIYFLNSPSENSTIFYLYYSKINFSEKLDSISSGSPASIRFIEENKVFFKLKILDFIYEGTKDYDSLKLLMKISSNRDFALEFRDDSEKILSMPISSTAQNIYVKEIPIQYYDEDANKKQGFLKIYTW